MMTVKTRRQIERGIVKLTVNTLLAAGKLLQLIRDDDGEAIHITDSSDATLDELMACDDEILFVGINGDWVRFVYGNGGWDVIADYTVNLEEFLAPVNAIADAEDLRAIL